MGKHPAHESSVGVLHYPALLGALGVLLLGLCEALQLAAATPLCRPLCLVLLGVGLVGHRCALLVRARGGPIAFLPPDWRDWVLESTPLDAAEPASPPDVAAARPQKLLNALTAFVTANEDAARSPNVSKK